MERHNDRAYWKSKAADLLKKQRGVLNVNLNRDYSGSDTTPAVGGEDGIYIGVMTTDMGNVALDEGTVATMIKQGYNPEHNQIDQIRFKRPAMYKAIKDSIIAVQATNEPVLSFLTEYAPLPEVYLLKMAPAGKGRIMWTMINVAKLASCTVTHWGPEVAEYLEENRLMR
jgi:hypothetical protein